MRQMGWTLFAVLLAALRLPAQVTVEVKLDQEQFLGGEPIPAEVRITNRSGQTLHLGAEPNWLTFSVESRDGFIVVKTGEVPVPGKFELESSKVATLTVDLAPSFVISRPGRYNVTASVNIKEWGAEVRSNPQNFDIVRGSKLWTREFGVPLPEGATDPVPEVRRFTLQRANFQHTNLKLYLRLTDGAESRLFKVFAVGPMVSFSQPEPQFDKDSNLHLLWQTGARSFSYLVVNPDGDVTLRQTYEYVNSRPRLQVDKEGKFSVAGGLRRPAENDFPRPESTQEKTSQPRS